MKNRQNNFVRASALQVALNVMLLFVIAIVFAATFKAAAPSVSNATSQQDVSQSGFYPSLPALSSGVVARPLGGPTPTCTPREVDDKITSNDSKELGRINPSGTASSCGAPNACNTVPGMFHYKEHTFVNDTGTDRCVTTTLSSSCSGTNAIFAAAYLDGFDPANICTNLIGDAGAIPNGSNASFSFNVPAGATFSIVVNEVTEGAGCAGYKVEIFGLCSTPTPTPAPTPTPNEKVSQITPTNVTCGEFTSGTAPTLDMLEYSLKGNPAYINQVNPGAFFYWVKFNAQAGSNTVTINESITSGNFSNYFAYLAGSNVFSSSCVSQHATVSQSGGTITLQFNAPSAGPYVGLVKFSSQSIKNSPAPAPGTTVHFDFSTSGVANSTEGVDLKKKIN